MPAHYIYSWQYLSAHYICGCQCPPEKAHTAAQLREKDPDLQKINRTKLLQPDYRTHLAKSAGYVDRDVWQRQHQSTQKFAGSVDDAVETVTEPGCKRCIELTSRLWPAEQLNGLLWVCCGKRLLPMQMGEYTVPVLYTLLLSDSLCCTLLFDILCCCL